MGKNEIGLKIKTGKINIEIPTETVVNTKGEEIIIDIREADKDEVQETNELIIQLATGAEVVTKPLVVETNYSGRTELILPLEDIEIPENETERQEFLQSLMVFVQHSDGENKLERGELQYDKDGNITGISIWVDRFSTFTLIKNPNLLTTFEGKKSKSSNEVMANKIWKIRFNKSIASNDIDRKIIVLDHEGNIFNTVIEVIDKRVRVIPLSYYDCDETYYLIIYDNVSSSKGETLSNSICIEFRISGNPLQ
ncbi:hypothetical protein [Oceanirhabdus seepicola]|uniref:SbsA Ig-like domain-containing protein n=1 Tax=Oceanirhabdus seepicola TaxID=2828781 RepID=A0A9J6NWP5_9CLOT|nr:hypothetical protein [Oceanirhabdus seepicola]MCM1988866.1 hypothetical protein [Oceanirhabdus seepicola]